MAESPPINEHTEFFQDLTLSSAFQPIISIAHRRAVGFEGLLRAKDHNDNDYPPLTVLQLPANTAEHLELDRLCRQLHANNFSKQNNADKWLFLNLNTQCLVMEKPDIGFMQILFEKTGLQANQIVIEILESEIDDRDYLLKIIAHFRQLGCLIAIDDFGAGHSNFDRIWELQPDIVKIDRSLIKRAAQSAKVERMLSGIISLIHEAGSLVIIEGIETEKEALVAVTSQADMLQGFYFAMPKASISDNSNFSLQIDHVLEQQHQVKAHDEQKLQSWFEEIKRVFETELFLFCQHGSFDECGKELFMDERAVRCNLLDEKGYQIGASRHSPHYKANLDLRFVPVLSGTDSNWSHRHYHLRAIQTPDVTQITRPYLSVTGSHMCVTLSQAVVIGDTTYVVCCDLDWLDE
ncbi:hypothetical protein LCGC14_1263560 [marine sediment metagenome]|uniref:EAL domain-containing protein n=1 Tax=marine sediment metagenome TaxID=412755 RepID=A0A0F9NGT8_9ZZZZ